MTARDIINEVMNNQELLLQRKALDDTAKDIGDVLDRAAKGNYEDAKQIEADKERVSKKIEELKRKQLLIAQLQNADNKNVQGGQIGSNTVGAGVSTPVQNKV